MVVIVCEMGRRSGFDTVQCGAGRYGKVGEYVQEGVGSD
jgi:hypothetical protein